MLYLHGSLTARRCCCWLLVAVVHAMSTVFGINITAPATSVVPQAATAAAAAATGLSASIASPPPDQSPPWWVHRMQADDGNPNKRSVAMWEGNRSIKYLISKDHWTLTIGKNGNVMGERSNVNKSAFGVLQFLTLSVMMMSTQLPNGYVLTPQPNNSNFTRRLYGRVAIRGNKTKRFVCMNKNGRVYSSMNFTDDCQFKEVHLPNSYYSYYSLKYVGTAKQPARKWYLGINRRGKMRLGHRTRRNQRCAQFLTVPNNEHFFTDNGFGEMATNSTQHRTGSPTPNKVTPTAALPKTTRNPKKPRKNAKRTKKGKRPKMKHESKRIKGRRKSQHVTPMQVQCGQSGIFSTCEIRRMESRKKSKRRRKMRRGKRRGKSRTKGRRKSANPFKTKTKGRDGPRGKTGVPLLS